MEAYLCWSRYSTARNFGISSLPNTGWSTKSKKFESEPIFSFFQTFFKAIFLKFAKILNQVYAKGGSSWPVAIDIDSAKINPNWNIGGIKIGGDFALLKLVNWKNHSWLKWLLLFNLEVGKFTLVCMKISKITYAHIFFKNYSNNL